ncbi:MAG: DUF5654 family protein [Candidatus Aenigmatarchaeota archaeon]
MAGLEEHAQKLDFRGLFVTSIITALAFVIGLFWRDAIIGTIDAVLPQGEGLIYKYVAAIVVTLIVVVIAYVLMHAQNIKVGEGIRCKVKARLKKYPQRP